MTRVVDRAFELEQQVYRPAKPDGLARPFGVEKHAPHRWRVSLDVWAELVVHVGFGDPEKCPPDAVLLGDPIAIDEALPPNSMLLEPVP